MTRDKTNNAAVNRLRARRRAAGLTTLGLPRGYRNDPSLLLALPDQPGRGVSLRKASNWIEKECLFCGALMISPKNRRIFCSVNCRRSYEFRQKNPLLAM